MCGRAKGRNPRDEQGRRLEHPEVEYLTADTARGVVFTGGRALCVGCGCEEIGIYGVDLA